MLRADIAASKTFWTHERVQQVAEQSDDGRQRDDVVHGQSRSQRRTKCQHATSEPMPTARYARSTNMTPAYGSADQECVKAT